MAVNRNPFHLGMLDLNIDIPDGFMQPTMEKFGITEKAVVRAQVRAVNKTVRWLKAQMARMVSKDVGVAQKHIKRRVWASWAKGQKTKAVFWAGVGGINPMTLGLQGRRLKTGYKVGRFFFKDGFRAYYKNKFEGKRGGVYTRKDEERMPINSEDIAIKLSVSAAIDRLFKRAEVELMKKFRQELNFEMKKKKAMGAL